MARISMEMADKAKKFKQAVGMTLSQLNEIKPFLTEQDMTRLGLDEVIGKTVKAFNLYDSGPEKFFSYIKSNKIESASINAANTLIALDDPFRESGELILRAWEKTSPPDQDKETQSANFHVVSSEERIIEAEKRIASMEKVFSDSGLSGIIAEAEKGLASINNSASSASELAKLTEIESSKAIEDIKDSTSKTYQVVVAEDYLGNAEIERVNANLFRGLSILGLVLSIALVISAFVLLPESQSSTTTVDAQEKTIVETTITYSFDPVKAYLLGSVTLLLSILSAYLARESSKHRVQMNAYKQIAMNISTVKKITGGLGEEIEGEIVTSLARYLFTNPVGVGQAGEGLPISTGEIISKAFDKISFNQGQDNKKERAD